MQCVEKCVAGRHFKVLLIILPVLDCVQSLIVHSHFRDSFSGFTGLPFSLPVTNNTSFYLDSCSRTFRTLPAI